MDLIGRDEILFDLLKNAELRILDAVVKKINIFVVGTKGLCIEVDFYHPQYDGRNLRLRFLGIKEYSFYHNDSHIFYNVECYKLIMDGELYYLSLDPEDEFSTEASDSDQDLIVFRNFEGLFLESNQANPEIL